MSHWAKDAFIYHIYPLGLCGAPHHNDFRTAVQHRIDYLYHWLDHLQRLGVNVVYLGPLFESSTHGYDTADYYHVDRRLGNRESLARLVSELHRRGIRVIFDAVFNHVGRDFWAFRDVLQKGGYSWYCDWFQDLKFGRRSPKGDPFTYKPWKKHYDLVKLNLNNKYVKEHLFKAVEMWIRELGADGLRLDAADCLKVGFIRELKKYCLKIKPDFWLLGELVHGDYRKRVNEKMLDCVTNYQCFSELTGSFNQHDFSQIARSLKWQSAHGGNYQNISLYSFADNHDVNRAASRIRKSAHLYPLYALMFTMPGIPSVYYGSEFAVKGKRHRHSDLPLRPSLNPGELYRKGDVALAEAIGRFSRIRQYSAALRHGHYTELYVAREQLAFARHTGRELAIVTLNSSERPAAMEFHVPGVANVRLVDLLNPGEYFYIRNYTLRVDPLWPNWVRILQPG